MPPAVITKRDGSTVPFDLNRIVSAISKAQQAANNEDSELALELAEVVQDHLDAESTDHIDIEDIQDAVLTVLSGTMHYEVASAYARYRDTRERERRQQRVDNPSDTTRPNIFIIDALGTRAEWDRDRLIRYCENILDLPANVSKDIVRRVESMLAETNMHELDAALLLSLLDAAMVTCGCHAAAQERAPYRMDRVDVEHCMTVDETARSTDQLISSHILRQWSLRNGPGSDVLRLYSEGRLWVDGLDNPRRGTLLSVGLDGHSDVWHIIATAWNVIMDARESWQCVQIIFPPMVLGALEKDCIETGTDKEADPEKKPCKLAQALDSIGRFAECYLYCDGRTPLLQSWPLTSKSIGLATYAEDFLLQGQLQELGLSMISGPHLMQPHYTRRIAVRLAINAEGLDENHSHMDMLAMALASAASTRLQHLSLNSDIAGTEVRYAIFGLPPGSVAMKYLEGQVVQEGLRSNIPLSRSTTLPTAACNHFTRLYGV